MNLKRVTQNYKLKLMPVAGGLGLILICVLWVMGSALSYAQEKLGIDGILEINSPAQDNRAGFVFKPRTAAPAAPVEGQMYYDEAQNGLQYYDSSAWQMFQSNSGDKTLASKIVAAKNSIDTAGGVNPRADYTCDGMDDQAEIQGVRPRGVGYGLD